MTLLAKARPGKPSIYLLLGPKGAGKSLSRIRQRDASLHIPIPEERIRTINAIAERIALAGALELANAAAEDADRFVEIFADRFLR